jgi:hypothetical protein
MANYKITMEIDLAEDFGSFQAIESKVREASLEAGQRALKEIMQNYDERYCVKKAVSRKDRRVKKYETLLGRISLNRWRVYDVFSKRLIYPLDLWMGLKSHQKVSRSLVGEIIGECVNRPYGKSTKAVNKRYGIKRNPVSNWKLVQGESIRTQKVKIEREEKVDWKKRGLPELKGKSLNICPILGIDPDATYVKSRIKDEKKYEIKMAVMYSGKSAKGKKKKRWELTGKQIILPPANSSADELFNEVTNKGVREYGLNYSTKVICHGDGDPWIKRFKTDYCPQALNRLDPWHVFKKIYEATDVEKIPKDWYESFYKNPRELINKIKEFKRQLVTRRDKERIDLLINYLSNNEDGMRPSKVSKEEKSKYPGMYKRGSGAIESNIFSVVCQRFKKPRMSWSRSGLNNLMFLRERYLNERYNFEKVKQSKEDVKEQTAVEEIRDVLRSW